MELDEIFEAPPEAPKDDFAYSFPEAIDNRSVSVSAHEGVDILDNVRERS